MTMIGATVVMAVLLFGSMSEAMCPIVCPASSTCVDLYKAAPIIPVNYVDSVCLPTCPDPPINCVDCVVPINVCAQTCTSVGQNCIINSMAGKCVAAVNVVNNKKAPICCYNIAGTPVC